MSSPPACGRWLAHAAWYSEKSSARHALGRAVSDALVSRHSETWTLAIRIAGVGSRWLPVRSRREALRTKASLTPVGQFAKTAVIRTFQVEIYRSWLRHGICADCLFNACFWSIAAHCPKGREAATALHSSVLLHHIHRNSRRSVTVILLLFFM